MLLDEIGQQPAPQELAVVEDAEVPTQVAAAHRGSLA